MNSLLSDAHLTASETLDFTPYTSVLDVFDRACQRFPQQPAFTCLGHTLTYQALEAYSRAFAAYLQFETDLDPGDRIAIQLPNCLQYPIVVFGALRAGLVVVNTNPLYTEREMQHQFDDSGAKALVVLANMAHLVQKILPATNIKHIIITEIADLHPWWQGYVLNAAVKYLKKQVPAYHMPQAVRLKHALAAGKRHQVHPLTFQLDQLAVLQYTGGTTGVAKGAMLTHANLVANMLQARAVITQILEEGQETVIAPLPMYHIYTFTVNCMVLVDLGNHSVLIPNPRDIPAFIRTLKKIRFSGFVGLNTLFVALLNQASFREVDFSALKLTISGGMALTHATAEEWQALTGCAIAEGYGMTETAPIVTFNPPNAIQTGSIGRPVPATEVKIIDSTGHKIPKGVPGELCVRGPQVMQGYWNRPQETQAILDQEYWLHTGDIAILQEDGFLRIVDRKKDMINVSGFNVYPNEIEDVVTEHPDIIEAAAIGVLDAKSGEAIKIFVVARNPHLNVEDVRTYCREHLTAYKVPKFVEFRNELPKSVVGKILRRQLRDEERSKRAQ